MEEEENLKDKVKILKCNKCKTVPYFKFYKIWNE